MRMNKNANPANLFVYKLQKFKLEQTWTALKITF